MNPGQYLVSTWSAWPFDEWLSQSTQQREQSTEKCTSHANPLQSWAWFPQNWIYGPHILSAICCPTCYLTHWCVSACCLLKRSPAPCLLMRHTWSPCYVPWPMVRTGLIRIKLGTVLVIAQNECSRSTCWIKLTASWESWIGFQEEVVLAEAAGSRWEQKRHGQRQTSQWWRQNHQTLW